MVCVKIEVFLSNGLTVQTEGYFEDAEIAAEEIVKVIDGQDSLWKDIGHLTLFYKSILGFSTEAI